MLSNLRAIPCRGEESLGKDCAPAARHRVTLCHHSVGLSSPPSLSALGKISDMELLVSSTRRDSRKIPGSKFFRRVPRVCTLISTRALMILVCDREQNREPRGAFDLSRLKKAIIEARFAFDNEPQWEYRSVYR